MKVRVLGTAAGGGLPQWNCDCARCTVARATGTGRLQDTLAVSGDGEAWYLLNASPDVRSQILACAELTPRGRVSPVRGVLLSTGELDHVLGLPMLREAESLTVYAHPTVLGALGWMRQVLAPYAAVTWQPTDGEFSLEGGLLVRTLVVGAKPPRYAAPVPGPAGWVSALRITDPSTGGSLVYASCLPAWSAELTAFTAGASLLLLDGTFVTDDEMTTTVGLGRSARSMGHLPVTDSLSAVAGKAKNIRYTHLNNTNPLLDPADPAHDALRAAGAAAARDGELFLL